MDQNSPIGQTPITVDSPSTTSKLPLIILILVLMGVSAAGGFYLSRFVTPTAPTPKETASLPTTPSTPTESSATISTTPTADATANWKTCTNSKLKFSLRYPQNFDIEPTTCNYVIMDYDLVKDIAVSNPTDDFRKNWLLIIETVKTPLGVGEWVEGKCTLSVSCSKPTPGPMLGSVQYDLLNVRYAETVTTAKRNDTIFNISLSSRNPDTSVSQNTRQIYNQILSTFRFLD